MVNVNNISIADAIAEAEESMVTMPVIAGSTRVGNGICSLGVVNSESNGKRLTFSKALSAQLGLEEEVSILPNIKTGELIVAKSIDSGKAHRGKLSGKDKKICYNAGMVQLVTQAFNLDFSERVSRSFSTVKFGNSGNDTYAFVKMTASPISGLTPVSEQDDPVVEEVIED